jgi:PAS domain S-box-containing protein
MRRKASLDQIESRSSESRPAPPQVPLGEFLASLRIPFTAVELFDSLTDVVYFVKDREARYLVVNQTLVRRSGMRRKEELLGRRADEVFPAPFGELYRAQDERLLQSGEPVLDELELHVYASGETGWCITNKVPLIDVQGALVGLVGTSRDLNALREQDDALVRLRKALDHMHQHAQEALRIADLAKIADLSPYQFDQRVRRLFGISAAHLVQKTRLDRAMRLLRETSQPISSIALASGYSDQSSFTRLFRRALGISPAQFRNSGLS